MNFLNNLRWKNYIVVTVLTIAISIVLLYVVHPMGSVGREELNIVEDVTTTTEITSTTTQAITTLQTISTSSVSSTTTSTTETTTTISVNTTTQVTEINSPKISEFVEEERIIISEPIIPEYVVYKPGTHYIHRNTCRWFDSSCYEISNTEGLECLYCTECKPAMEIITPYEVPQVSTSTTVYDDDFIYLCRIVYHEAGSYWISEYDKARVAAGVMNRVKDSRFPGTVLGVLTQHNQFSGFNVYADVSNCTNYQACVDAVNAYLSNPGAYGSHNSWYGDGRQNYFYTI